MSARRKRPHAAPKPTSTMRDRVLLDHIINLTHQVRELARHLREAGIFVPPDVGTLGPASDEVARFYLEESLRTHGLRPIPAGPGKGGPK